MQIITDRKRLPKNALLVIAAIGWAGVLYLCWVVLNSSIERTEFAIGALMGQIPELDPFNERYRIHPWQTIIHTTTGVIFAVLGPLQFMAPLRRRLPKLHRITGRIFLPAAIFNGLVAFTISLTFPMWGSTVNLFIGVIASAFMVFAFVQAFRCVRQRKFAQHREWMMRGFAIGLGVALFRVLLNDVLPPLGIEDFQTRWNIVTVVCFPIMLILAELWIRATRPARPAAPASAAQVQPGA